MSQIVWSQDIFSKGELSPLMYSRISVNAYYNGLKNAKNCITYPQGAVGKRFGTLFQNVVTGITDYREIYFASFQYLNQCTYILVIIPGFIDIYLEGILVASIANSFTSAEIRLIDTTTLDTLFRVCTGVFKPKDLVRGANTPNAITAFTSSTLTVTTPITQDLLLPATFSLSGMGPALPTTSPQIRTNQVYFVYFNTTTTFEIYTTAEEAKARTNAYTISSSGTGASLVTQNNWTFPDVVFRTFPVFDFDDVNYESTTFTPGSTSGYNVNLTASASTFDSSFIGGSYSGNGGICRIISISSATVAVVNIITSFANTNAIPGTLSLLTKPAWSDTNGWPSKCSSFQNRCIFANTRVLTNGLWLSVINDYNDFNDLQTDDDNAISWFPSSDNVNFIRFIVPYRSLTIHTNTGIYSTPLSVESAITPSTFSLSLQDSTPATAIQPRGIDNQIIILSGNDVHSMLWDGFNNSYTSSIASIANEHLIRNPHDETAYVDLRKAGSRYMFIINEDGTMTVFQTLISEDVSGFTPAVLNQSYGEAYFRWAVSSSNGRAWFLVERWLADEGSPVSIIGNTDDSLEATASNFSTDSATLCQFTTAGDLPESSPQIETDTWYWAIGVDANNFKVYLSKEDAEEDVDAVEFLDFGSSSSVIPWPTAQNFFIEELSFDVFVDCATVYNGVATSTITGQNRFNGQNIKINGDGFGFDDFVIDDDVQIEAHGAPVEVSSAFLGFPIDLVIEPLQVAPPGPAGFKSSSLVLPQHIRVAYFMFNETIGGTITGYGSSPTPIQLQTLNEIIPGEPPVPQSGIMEMSFTMGWNLQNTTGIIIEHDDPFDIRLIGIFYRIES